MPLFSCLLDNYVSGALAYKPNFADLTFPLEHHNLFEWSLDLLNLLTETYSEQGEISYLKINPDILQLLVSLVTDVLRRLARASYGGNCLPGTLDLRLGALTELGVNTPSLYHFVRLFCDHQPFAGNSIIDADKFYDWTDWFQDAVEKTKTWIIDARFRAETRPNGWNFGPGCFKRELLDTLGYDPRDPYFPSEGPCQWPVSEPATDLIPHPVIGPGAQNSLVLYRPSSTRLWDATSSQCTDLIPHPILGPGAHNALALYQPLEGNAPNTCTDLIPHPVLGPGAQNALIAYRASSTIRDSLEGTDSQAYEDPTHYEVTCVDEFDEVLKPDFEYDSWTIAQDLEDQYNAQGFSMNEHFEAKEETSD